MAILSPESDYCDVVLELTDPGSRSARIRLSGEFDISNCWRIRDVFARAVDLGYTALQVDMSEVSFIGSASLRELLLARRLASDANIQATVISASPVASRVMTLMGLDLFNGGRPNLNHGPCNDPDQCERWRLSGPVARPVRAGQLLRAVDDGAGELGQFAVARARGVAK